MRVEDEHVHALQAPEASMAAEPVSPEVAPTMAMRPPERDSAAWKSCPMSCIATSLKASVGP
jgi:hypothetical protein